MTTPALSNPGEPTRFGIASEFWGYANITVLLIVLIGGLGNGRARDLIEVDEIALKL